MLEKLEEGKITLEKMMVIPLKIDVPEFKTPYETPQGSILLKESNRNVILGKGMSDKQPGDTPSDNANSHRKGGVGRCGGVGGVKVWGYGSRGVWKCRRV